MLTIWIFGLSNRLMEFVQMLSLSFLSTGRAGPSFNYPEPLWARPKYHKWARPGQNDIGLDWAMKFWLVQGSVHCTYNLVKDTAYRRYAILYS